MSMVHKLALAVSISLAMVFTLSCSSAGGGSGDTYYVEKGGISVAAYNILEQKKQQDPNMTAEEALNICHQNRVIGDEYFYVEQGVSRKKLEQYLDDFANADEKTMILRNLDKNGHVFAWYIMNNNDMIYLYGEKE